MRTAVIWAPIAVAVLLSPSCASDRSAGNVAPANGSEIAPLPLAQPEPTSTVRIGPLTPRDPDRITADARDAIELLGASDAGEPADGHGHEHGAPAIDTPLFTGDKATFAHEWLVAQASTARFDTLAKIEQLGYVRSSAPIGGIGSHWVLWPHVADAFDPAWPSMVLFDESRSPARLVGYSYWVQSPTEPVGFAGENDHWHQHQGLCIVNGWVDRERSSGPDACAGTYLAGGDLWMLHAWPVAGYENRHGNFATFNPKLCPAAAGVPDVARCPED